MFSSSELCGLASQTFLARFSHGLVSETRVRDLEFPRGGEVFVQFLSQAGFLGRRESHRVQVRIGDIFEVGDASHSHPQESLVVLVKVVMLQKVEESLLFAPKLWISYCRNITPSRPRRHFQARFVGYALVDQKFPFRNVPHLRFIPCAHTHA